MRKKIIGILVCMLLIATVLPVVGSINGNKMDMIKLDTGGECYPSVPDAVITQAVADGVAWLVKQQNYDPTIDPKTDPNYGSWGADTGNGPALTALALIKLQDYAYELGYTPFDINYIYNMNVYYGWWYLFSYIAPEDSSQLPKNGVYLRKYPISSQLHANVNTQTIQMENPDFWDNPDTPIPSDSDGIGLYLGNGKDIQDDRYMRQVYYSGIFLMALAGLGCPDCANFRFLDFDDDGNSDTYREIAQNVVDWLAFAQSDYGDGEGGYGYSDINNTDKDRRLTEPDNSNSGYAYLGLAAASAITSRPGVTALACSVPSWVKRELNQWIDYIQYDEDPSDQNDDDLDGGSGYSYPWYWINTLKTGNLIFEMIFYGDNPNTPRMQRAVDYLERHWRDPTTDPGWGYTTDPNGNHGSTFPNPATYQAMFCIMKGLEYSGIELIDTDDTTTTPDVSWFNNQNPVWPYDDFASVLVDQQYKGSLDITNDGEPDYGCWPASLYSDSTCILSTTWALLTLERVVPLPNNLHINKEATPAAYHVGDKITYTINYMNPTKKTIHNVYIIDYIPSCTTFYSSPNGNYNPSPPHVRWNLGDLLPGAIGSVSFVVTVVDSSCVIIHNDAYIYSDETDPNKASADIYPLYEAPPPSDPYIDGSNRGTAEVEYNYTFVSTDPDSDHRIFYFYDWGDETSMEYIGPCESGEEVTVNHTWGEKGKYTIKVMAVNEYNAKSNWTTMEVTMSKNKAINIPLFLQRFFQRFPFFEKILNQIILT